MIPNPSKAWLYVGVVTLAFGLLFTLYYQHNKIKSQKVTITKVTEDKNLAIATINKMAQDSQKAESNRTNYLSDLENSENERKRLEKCIADKSCVATVRVFVKSACTATSTSDTGGIESTTAQLDPDSGRAYTNLRAGIENLEAKYKLCQVTLQDWARQ